MVCGRTMTETGWRGTAKPQASRADRYPDHSETDAQNAAPGEHSCCARENHLFKNERRRC